MSAEITEMRDFPDSLGEKDVWACLGSPDRTVPALAEEVAKGLALYREVCSSRALYARLPVDAIERRKVIFRGGLTLDGAFMAHCFEGAAEAVFVVVTIGAELEERVARHFAEGDDLEAIVLDAVGSAAVMDVFSHVANWVFDDVATDGWQIGMCLMPGQSYWDITGQRAVFQVVDAGKISVELLESCFMQPQKSQSAVVPIGPELKYRWRENPAHAPTPRRWATYMPHVTGDLALPNTISPAEPYAVVRNRLMFTTSTCLYD